jgi:ABC-type transporter Mla maintaining outer membrane lipid asymmetry ATPase subunit MlaF
MTHPGPALVPLRITALRKDYRGLRPFRLQSLVLEAGERVAIAGVDAAPAEVLVGLITGAVLPDEGEVEVLGRSTAAIRDEREWFGLLDRFGIVSHRAVLLEAATIRQNLALPFTLQIDPTPPAVGERLAPLAAEAGLDPARLDEPMAAATPEVRCRVHLARGLALDPVVLLLEHPTTALAPAHVGQFARDVGAAARRRELAVLALTDDAGFAAALGGRSLKWQAATGALVANRGWRRWL